MKTKFVSDEGKEKNASPRPGLKSKYSRSGSVQGGSRHLSRDPYLEGLSVFRNTRGSKGCGKARGFAVVNLRRNNHGEQTENFNYENIIDGFAGKKWKKIDFK